MYNYIPSAMVLHMHSIRNESDIPKRSDESVNVPPK